MKRINIVGQNVSQIALGLMRMHTLSITQAAKLLDTALAQGINFYDHANIYGKGKSEEVFAAGVKEAGIKREDMIIQSKCAIRQGFYDFSKEHILDSVDGILKRLNVEYLDYLLLHRPDALMEPSEVAEAFDSLVNSGKVRHFGVSNHNPMQIELLKKCVKQKIVINQLQLSLVNTGMIDAGLTVNTKYDNGIMRDGSVLDYCRLKDITIQPWSPFQYGMVKGVYIDNIDYPQVNEILDKMAKKYETTKSSIAIAWILRHPANMQPIIGSMNNDRIVEICKGSNIDITREDWYELYRANGNILP